jgi:hypothetical protein
MFTFSETCSRKTLMPPITASQTPEPEMGGHMVLQTVRFVTDEERAAIMQNLQKVLDVDAFSTYIASRDMLWAGECFVARRLARAGDA